MILAIALLCAAAPLRLSAQTPADSVRWRRAAVPRIAAYIDRAVPTGRVFIARVDDGPGQEWVDSMVHDLRWVVASLRSNADTAGGRGVSIGLPRQLPDSAVDWLTGGRGLIQFVVDIVDCRRGQLETLLAEVQVASTGDSVVASVIPRGMGSGVCGH